MTKFMMRAGKFIMTPGGKWSSECPGCQYKASDGSAHQEDFSAALDPGWTQATGTWSTSGGRLQETSFTSGLKIIRRSDSVGTDILDDFIVEAVLYRVEFTIRLAVTIGDSVDPLFFQWFQDTTPLGGASATHTWRYGNTQGTVSATRNDGDRLSIRVQRTGTNIYRACYFLNTTLLHGVEGVSWTPQPTLWHGMFLEKTSGSTGGEFDLYTAEIQSSP